MASVKIIRTGSSHPDFVSLVKLLDQDLAVRNGDEMPFYAQFNKIDSIKNVVVAFADDQPVSCGAFKFYAPGTVEIKRMFTLPEYRGRKLATRVLQELEQWAAALGYNSCILETGKKQTEALNLYPKNGYNIIPNYGQYAGVENSVCFEKKINPSLP